MLPPQQGYCEELECVCSGVQCESAWVVTLWSSGTYYILRVGLLGTGVRKCHPIENAQQTHLCPSPHHPEWILGEELQRAGGWDMEERSCVSSSDSSRNWSQYTGVQNNLGTVVHDGQHWSPRRPKKKATR